MVIIIAKLNNRRVAIVFLYGPVIGTSSASLLHELDENQWGQFCCYFFLEIKIYIFCVFNRWEPVVFANGILRQWMYAYSDAQEWNAQKNWEYIYKADNLSFSYLP